MEPRVLVVAPRLDVGGTEVHISRVLPALRKAGLDVAVFTFGRGGALERPIIEAGVPVLGAASANSGAIRGLRAIGALRREIRQLRPNVLHFFLPEPYLVGSLASVGMSGLVRIMSRRSLSDYQRNYPVFAFIERQVHRSAAALIGNSSAVAAQLVEECAARAKVGIIHNGLELPVMPSPEQRSARRRDLGLTPDAFVIVVVANLIHYKGHDDLLEAFGQIRKGVTRPWHLMLVGRDDGIGRALKQKAEALGIGGNILWLNERRDALALLAAADLGVLPSHQEGFSNSLIEMMAYGLPVVATEVGGNCDAIIDGESGLLVPVRQPAALGAAIHTLVQDAGLRARLGAAARQRVERFFSLEACVLRYLRLYRGIVRDRIASIPELIDPSEHTSIPVGGTELSKIAASL